MATNIKKKMNLAGAALELKAHGKKKQQQQAVDIMKALDLTQADIR